MQRRTFLIASSSSALFPLAERAPRAAAMAAEPWFEPEYSVLPTLEQQTKGLDPAALAAQNRPRTADGLPVTGLPVGHGSFDRKFAALVRSAGFVGVAFAVAVNRHLVLTRGFGHLSSHDRAPVTPTNPGYLGSITKPLCAMTALTLVREGKLKLHDRVVALLPLTPLLKSGERRQAEIDHVTVRMLMNHTSGLFNVVEDLFDDDYYRQLARAHKLKLVHGDISQYDLVRRGMARPFVSKPGAEYHYSGQGLQVLGRIVEKLTGQRLDRAMSARVLAPLGINHHATFSYLAPKVFAQIAAGKASATHTFIPSPFDAAAHACRSWAFPKPNRQLYGHHWGQADACGSSMLSAVNLLRFVTFCPDLLGKPLATEALSPTKKPPFSNGLGWGVSMTSGRVQYGHSGAIDGLRAFCESTWDGVQYAVLAAGDRDEGFDKMVEVVRDLGRSLRGQRGAGVGWKEYGFH